jgi:pimeloyl-ACP methyl ester carboxylesterase
MFLHGGPGAGCHKFCVHFFNPERYTVILFDQRGCGKSTPSASDDDATERLKTGSPWVHLRLCRTCGHVGCCDDSPNRHATRHFQATRHPVIEGYDPPEGWGWCYIDEVMLDLSDRATRHNGPIPRYY